MRGVLNALVVSALLLSRLDSPVTDRAEALSKEVLKLGNDPRDAAPLIRLHSLIDDLNILADPYSSLIYRRNTDPHVRDLARIFMADVERARGRTQKAAEQISELGFIQDFHVVGSFDNEGKAGCDTDFGPESATDLKATYPAKAREIGWRHRTHFLARFPEARFVLVRASDAVRVQRLEHRTHQPLDAAYTRKMVTLFDEPLEPYAIIDNTGDANSLAVQLDALVQRLS